MSTHAFNAWPTPAAGRILAWRHGWLASGLGLALLLGGCASRSPWKQEAFALTVPAAGETGSATHTNIMTLRRVTVSPLFAGKPLVYRTGDNSYEQDPYAEFLVPPNQMLEACWGQGLLAGHAFAGVLGPDSDRKSDCAMEVSVNQLYGDFRQPVQPGAVLQMRLMLYSTQPADYGRVLWQREFAKRLPLAQRTPAALVAGWNAGMQEVMAEVNTELTHLAVPETVQLKTVSGDGPR
jgi:uncharacterized lipoprotein YmbA